jgi:hypothetical protein
LIGRGGRGPRAWAQGQGLPQRRLGLDQLLPSFFPTHAVDESDELDAKRGEVGAHLDDEVVKGACRRPGRSR